MKSILAIFAIGLLIATAMSGCVGGEKTSGTDDTMTGTDTTGTDTAVGNETENQTAGNQTTGKTEMVLIYHKTESGTADTATFLLSCTPAPVEYPTYPFPVNSTAKKIQIKFKGAAMPTDAFGTVAFIYDTNGNEVTTIASSGNTEGSAEIKAKQIEEGGFGEWTYKVVTQAPDASSTYEITIDIYGIAA
jgi:hypothetical protein